MSPVIFSCFRLGQFTSKKGYAKVIYMYTNPTIDIYFVTNSGIEY